MSSGAERGAAGTFHSCNARCPRPVGSGHSEPCVVSCGTSRVIIYPPPVVVTFPGPIISTCPQQAVVGCSAVPVVGCSAVPEVGQPAPGTSRRAELLRPEPRAGRFIPKHSPEGSIPKNSPRRGQRCSYVFASRWVHPCSRAGYRCHQPAGREREEPNPGKEEPESGKMDTGDEGQEASEAPQGDAASEDLPQSP